MDIEGLVAALTLDEKAALTVGADSMGMVAVERLGIPTVQVTDGPSGARGPTLPGLGGPESTCIPCGSAIGASWDPGLAEALGALVGREALERGCRGLLAPTVNLHRHPLAGRNFECYSEDPLLTGRVAAGYVRGVQSNGVFATVKHFVGNDAEFERDTISSVIDERSLRELYLLPFEIVVRESGVLALMTSYNRLNGRWMSQQPELLIDILRNEWGFDGMVMTDWFAMADTVESLAAGLDLEMPGPGRALGSAVSAAVGDGRVHSEDVERAVGHLLSVLDRVGALEAETPTVPRPPSVEDLELLRRASAATTVLLTNDGVLPIDPSAVGRVAVLGPNASAPTIVGGGSAQMSTPEIATPLEAISALFGPNTQLVHELGCDAGFSSKLLGEGVFASPDRFHAEFFDGTSWEGNVVKAEAFDTLRLVKYNSFPDPALADEWSVRVRGTVTPAVDGIFEFALAQSGRARLLVDGSVLVDGFVDPPGPGGTDFFGMASVDLVGELTVKAGVPIEVIVEYARIDCLLSGFRVGFLSAQPDKDLERAVEAAADAEVVVLIVGTTEEWETEGRDRPMFELPGRQPELIRRVAAVNDRVVVVVNAGSPVDLSWADDVSAVLQCWFGGQEMAAGLASVLSGRSEPGGRLATTIPQCLEHSPSYDNFPGENGELRYGEGLFMGYRGFEHRRIEPRFPFGHGLSYTTFELGEPIFSAEFIHPEGSLAISVPVTNTGRRSGSEVIQCYVTPESPRLHRPPQELKAFAKVSLAPGASSQVDLHLDGRAFAYWDPGQPDHADVIKRQANPISGIEGGQERRVAGWQVDPGRYRIRIGRSSTEPVHASTIEVTAAGSSDPSENRSSE